MESNMWLWIGFTGIVMVMLALDLGVFHRTARLVTVKEATTWTLVWVSLAVLFGAAIFVWKGPQPALEFATGYLIEEALSIDNIFVFVLIFGYFRVPPLYQHRVLFWGVLGAQAMRALLIGVGAALISQFSWILYVFGAFLLVTGVKMAFANDEVMDPGTNPVVRLFRRLMPVTDDYDGHKFFTRKNGVLFATPLFLVLVLVETSDLIFAVDSIPAIFGVTQDPFLVYTSNIFAILGLRSLYFLLAGVMGLFRFLKLGLAGVLAFIGTKMLVAGYVHVPIGVSLGAVFGILAVSIAASLLIPDPKGIKS